MSTAKETARPVHGALPFVWSIQAEDVGSSRAVIALVAGGRSAFEPRPSARAHDTEECSFFVESRRGEVVIQLLAELEPCRVFASMRFDLAADGAAEALRTLRAQTSLTLHALSPSGALLGTAHLPIGVARRAWLDSALERAARGASAG